MKHNNQLPNNHFRKEWQKRVRTWFNQPGRKLRRHRNRVEKAARVAPKPVEKLRPAVRCPTVRYNRKVRVGRGFTLDELKAAKIAPKFAQSVGIVVDYRRRNRSEESLNMNVLRLKDYKSRLIVLPRNNKKRTPELVSEYKNTLQVKGSIVPISNTYVAEAPRAITEEEKKSNAYYTLRQARANQRYRGVRDALAKARAEQEAQKAKK
ncbi:60S ribosomal protein L13 [Zancudomyces culisetae]|uniref:60S ribosomal protein L13 n=1 Tax=Zancudomyces culisetae TaxID=1213189 RepID=A0A1R1PYM6_ZANCU|nr:60S ribosomal protein L13 [Zancudomyces culisetae]|eukprot:OMH86072.1 60S ribosomal protein L13 [Zancudomyces culisetae]